MLLSFRVANHRSIREEQQLLLSPVYDTDRPEGTAREAVPVVALFGANAAGKSNVVDALRFMADMVRSSHRNAEPGSGISRTPFLLDAACAADPSWYVVDLLLQGVRYVYGFSVDDERVRDEWLYSYPKGRKRTVFQREGDEIHFGDSAPKRELDLVQNITEPNVLFLSIAARSRQEVVLPVYEWFFQSLGFRQGGVSRSTRGMGRRMARILRDADQAAAVVALLRAADVGIEAAGVQTFAVDEMELILAKRAGFTGNFEPSTWVWVGQRGRNGPVRMGLEDQSEGTRALLSYAEPVLGALRDGGLLAVDEIDSSLHPRLTAHLIKLFQDPATNPEGAQLLLTTHDASLLGRSGGEDVLRRDQVWFVEKNEYGETTLFPLSDFKPRQEENRERRYLGGSYGAVPFLSDERFEAAVAARGRADGGADPEE
ncbi:AAA family ATPase [Streptomyces sp. CA-111067]|uniref:AAA family ATPase n=1 Tax=Streptomyces sp. CA-111067 TaxID=3240046 RepID=UPI003D980E2D